MTKSSTNAAGFYSGFFKGWSKALGDKPTAELLATVHALGARPGKQALANAMMLRPGGATNAQIVMACGAPQLNKMRELVARKLVKRDMNVAPGDNGHTVYKITLAAAGVTKVAKATADAAADGDKPAKAPRKARAKRKAPAPQPEAPQAPAGDGQAPQAGESQPQG